MVSPTFELKKDGQKTLLVITCELPMKKGEAEVSKSGKSLMHASTNGNLNTGLKVNGSDLIVGLNAYTKVPK